jgi:tetratricopeptide (TPR) repeat protein
MPDTTDLDALIDQALELHNAGRLHEAERIYREVLLANPQHADALNFLGVIAMQAGNLKDAEMWLARSIQSGGGADAHNNYGEVLRRQDKLRLALVSFEKAVAMDPNYPEAWCNRGLVYQSAGDNKNAEASFFRAVQLDPNLPQAHYNLGVLYESQGKTDQAIQAWRQTLRLVPDHVEALNNLGVVLTRRGELEQAIELLNRAIQVRPDTAAAYANLASAVSQTGAARLDEAIDLSRQGVHLAPEMAETHYNLAEILMRADQLDEALPHAQTAVQIQPDLLPATSVLAAIYERMNRGDDALEVYEAAARRSGDNPDVLSSLSTAYRAQARDRDALAVANRAIRIKPDHAEAHANRAFALLAGGEYREGFLEYEWRWKCKGFSNAARDFGQPLWTGRTDELKDKTILIHAEQGFGDVIQFARYLPLVAQRGARVIAEVPRELQTLVATMKNIDQVVARGDEPPAFDLHMPMLSLPGALKTTLENLPREVPYFHPDDSLKRRWKQRIESSRRGAAKTVGLTWGGSILDLRRSVKLAQLAPLMTSPGVRFFSLQKGSPADELMTAPAEWDIVDLGPELNDFADTAAALANLDLLVTIDTAIAHLGGAMASKTWTMLVQIADWRWMHDREDSPWYPTMRLFRQPLKGDWNTVIAAVVQALRKL